MDNIELLKETLEKNSPILYLGAGFSLGSFNDFGMIPDGRTLKDKIINQFYNIENLSSDDLDEITKMSLNDLVYDLKVDGKKDELIEYLINIFSKCKSNSFHNKLCMYNWRKIYTTNIDDLIENIYKNNNKNCIIEKKIETSYVKDVTKLYKLHGCVNLDKEFIFDTNDYLQKINQVDFKIESFCTDYHDNDIIFVGTNFDELDIQAYLMKAEAKGFTYNNNKKYFITPKLSRKLKNLISSDENKLHIEMTAEKFVEMASNINLQKSKALLYKNKLHSIGLDTLEDYKYYDGYDSKLYYGANSNFQDIINGYDIEVVEDINLIDQLSRGQGSKIWVVEGKSYSGKSVFIKQILKVLYENKYKCFSFEKFEDCHRNEFVHYLNSITDKQIALSISDSASFLPEIISFFQSFNKKTNEKKIILVLELNENELDKNFHYFENIKTLNKFHIDGKLTEKARENFYNKLEEKNSLGYYEFNIKKIENRKKKIERQNNIIECLFYATKGDDFKKYFEKFINECKFKDTLNEIAILTILGYKIIDQHILLIFNNKENIKFLNDSQIIDIYFNFIKLRFSEYLSFKILNEVNMNKKIEIIKKYLSMISSNVEENENNKYSKIFRQLSSYEKLRKFIFFDNKNKLEEFFASLEKKYSKISYYWLQRGLLKSDYKEYDKAQIYLEKARQISPDKYKVIHACEHNKIKRGLYLLRINSQNGQGKEYCNEGFEEMMNLILNKYYNHSKSFAVYTYIDMKIDFLKITKSPFTIKKFNEFIEIIKKSNLTYDWKKKLTDKIIYFAKSNKISFDKIKKFEKEIGII